MQGHQDILPLGLLPLRLRVLFVFLYLLHERTRRRIRLCRFCTLIDTVAETAIVSFYTLPVGFPLPTISKNSLHTLFCPLILDHGVLLKISIPDPKILISNILLVTSSHHRLQSVIIRSSLLLMSLHVAQFQYGLELLRLVLLICTSCPKFHQMGFASSITEFRPISNRIPEYDHFEEQS